MRVLVTGGSGFIGTNLVAALRARGEEVVNLDSAPPRDPGQGTLWCRRDLLDAKGLAADVAAHRPTHVVHLGARTDLHGTELADYAANTTGTANLLAALAPLPESPRLLVASSRMVCRIGYQPRGPDDVRPPNAYGESKVQTERLVRASDHPGGWVIVRPTSIWGPWFGVPYRDFFLAVARGRYVHPGDRHVLKSFGYVENSVAQLLGLLWAPRDQVDGLIGYLADYEPIDVLDLARRVAAAAGVRPPRRVPLGILRAGALGGDLARRLGWREPPLTSYRLDNLLTGMLHDLAPLRAVVPELPVELGTAVPRTVAWLRDAGEL